MKAQGAWAMGGLAALGLAAAWGVAQRAPETGSDAVVVLEAGRKDVQSIRYEDAVHAVELRPREGAGDGAVWVKTVTKAAPEGAAAADAGLPDAGVAEAADAGTAAPPAPDRELPGNELAQSLFRRFSPLSAARGLGVVESAKLPELGLDSPQRALVVGLRSGEVRWEVGASTLGLTSPYLREPRTGRVYLLGGGIITDLDAGASRLVDRRLHAFNAQEYDSLRVTRGGRTRTFQVSRGEPGSPVRLLDDSGKADDFARNWHDRLFRLATAELLGRGEAPAGGEPEIGVRVDYFRGKTSLGHVEVAFAKDAGWARTEFTAGWARLTGNLVGLEQEADRVLEVH
jgi:hypothetical protein